MDKNRNKNVEGHSVRRNHARSLRKLIFKCSLIKIARDARILHYILLCSCAHDVQICCAVVRWGNLSLSLLEGPFSVCLEAFVNCSNKITWNFQHLYIYFAPNYRVLWITVFIGIVSVSIKCKGCPSLPQNRSQNPPRGAPPGTLAEGPQNTKHTPAHRGENYLLNESFGSRWANKANKCFLTLHASQPPENQNMNLL